MQAPPGWYPDPGNPTLSRWWDGNVWTSHTAPRAYDPWTPTPTRRRRIWPWIVFPVVGVLILLGVAAAILVPRVVGEFKHPVDAANVYLRDIRDERFSAAYKEACTLRYGSMTFDQYVQLQRDRDAKVGRLLRFNAHEVHRVAGHSNEAIVDVDATTTQGHFPVEVDMIKEGEHWRWCGSRDVSK